MHFEIMMGLSLRRHGPHINNTPVIGRDAQEERWGGSAWDAIKLTTQGPLPRIQVIGKSILSKILTSYKLQLRATGFHRGLCKVCRERSVFGLQSTHTIIIIMLRERVRPSGRMEHKRTTAR